MNSVRDGIKLSLTVGLIIVLIAVAFVLGYRSGENNHSDLASASDVTEQVSTPVVQPTDTSVPVAPTATASADPAQKPTVDESDQQEPLATPERTEGGPEPTPGASEDASDLTDEEALQLLQEVWDLVDAEFYGDLPPAEERVYGAIRGMLETLDDDYTSFLEPSIAEIERTDASGSFEGIGALVRMNEDNILEIVRPFEGQPAAEAGLLPGDKVLKVDGESIVGYGIYEAITLIRGPRGTEVVLTVQRGADATPFEVTIVRARIEIPIVESRMLENNIGYVSLFEFTAQATMQLEEAIVELLDEGATALVLDLRDNPGGFLDQSVKVADLFLDEGVVLIERVSNGSEREFPSTDQGLAQDIPLVLLVNGGSASASEIVAGAIQDRGRGILIGETTFGKGSVQLPHTLSNGAELRVTIARWFTPNDRAIHGEGLEPDIQVPTLLTEFTRIQEQLSGLADDLARGEISQDEFDRLSEQYQSELKAIEQQMETGVDAQLERAVEYLMENR